MKSIPKPLLHDLLQQKHFVESDFIAAHQLPPVTSVRLNPAKPARLYEANDSVPWCPLGRYLPERPVFTIDPAFHAGAYYVQEASSMFLHHILKQITTGKSRLRVLDLCAAPGGKSTLIASVLDSECLLVSNEVIRSRATILDENMTRWGYSNTFVTANDPRDFSALEGFFDVIVVDAPCSGSGLFRKDERALNDWTESNVTLCWERQRRILADILPALKTGGTLIYATCSYSFAEDEQILDWLAQEFKMDSLPITLNNDWGIVSVSSPQHSIDGFRFYPDKVKGEGFFIAALTKTNQTDGLKPSKFKSQNIRKIGEQVAGLINIPDAVYLKAANDEYFTVLAQHETDLQTLQKCLYLRKAGLRLGQPGQKDWIPAHDIALSINVSANVPTLELNKLDAQHFLKKEDFAVQSDIKGWRLIKYEGLGLGWVKLLGNRMNNYLPKNLRIRMEINNSLYLEEETDML